MIQRSDFNFLFGAGFLFFKRLATVFTIFLFCSGFCYLPGTHFWPLAVPCLIDNEFAPIMWEDESLNWGLLRINFRTA